MDPTPPRPPLPPAPPAAAANECLQEAYQQHAILLANARKEKDALAVQAAAVAAQQSAMLAEEARLIDRQRALELQEQQLAGHFEEQRGQLQAQEERLHKEIQKLVQERADFGELFQRQTRELEQAQRQYREQQQFENERGLFDGDKAQLQKHGKRRWDSQWANLSEETKQLAEGRETLEHDRRAFNGEVELSRRQLEASWSQLRREQQEWRAQRQQQEVRLRECAQEHAERAQNLEETNEQLQHQLAQGEAARADRRQELLGLESRIRNSRQKLAALQEEAQRLEALIGDTDALLPLAEVAEDPLTNARPEGIAAEAVTLLLASAEDLEDESRRSADLHVRMVEIRRAWRGEWAAALDHLAEWAEDLDRREDALQPRAQELSQAEHALQLRCTDQERLHQHLQCWEARLFKQQSAFHAERGRLVDIVKAKGNAARERHKLLRRLRRQWLEDRQRDAALSRKKREAVERVRKEYVQLRERLRDRLAELDDRERRLLEQELVLTQVQEQLLAQDPQPAAAGQELEHRRRHWLKLAMRPVRAARKLRNEIDARARHLETVHQFLVEQQEELDKRSAACAELESNAKADQANLAAERIRWKYELQSLRDQRTRLEGHSHDLQQQIERLVLLLVNEDRPNPPLALAA